jgi:hypothetical protein
MTTVNDGSCTKEPWRTKSLFDRETASRAGCDSIKLSPEIWLRCTVFPGSSKKDIFIRSDSRPWLRGLTPKF